MITVEFLEASILGPLLFNIYTCEIFCKTSGCDNASFYDDNTLQTISYSFKTLINQRKVRDVYFNCSGRVI